MMPACEAEESERVSRYVVGLEETDRTRVALVGGKGAHLGELLSVKGIRVPAGFCVTTEAFRRMAAEAPSLPARLDALSKVEPDDRDAIGTISTDVRQRIERTAIPDDVADAITRRLAELGDDVAYAVRSSATAEDLPSASFAGQQDTYLNAVGPAAILQHVSRCWASLFTERAVTYRLRGGIDHRNVSMAVVIQQMVFPEAAGVLFTADPVTSQPQGHVRGGQLRPRRGAGLRPRDPGRLQGARRRGRRADDRGQAARRSTAVPAGGTQEQAIDPERQQTARPERRAGGGAGPAGQADRGALRLPAGHRVVPRGRRLLRGPEPADHHAVPDPAGRRRHEPRVRLRRSPADDDRPDEAPRALHVAAHDPAADEHRRRQAVRRRHPDPRLACKPGRPARALRQGGSVAPGRAGDRDRTRRLPARPDRRRVPALRQLRRWRRRALPSRSSPTRPGSPS